MVCLVALPLIAYCVWKKKTQRKLRQLAAEVTAGTVHVRAGEDEVDAPPSYLTSEGGDRLPVYTKQDPHKPIIVETTLATPAKEDATPQDNTSNDIVNSSDNQPLLEN